MVTVARARFVALEEGDRRGGRRYLGDGAREREYATTRETTRPGSGTTTISDSNGISRLRSPNAKQRCNEHYIQCTTLK